MIDVACERLLTKEEAADHCKVSVPTIERWIRYGVRKTGRRLESVYVGGSIRTSVEAIARFCVHPASDAFDAPIETTEARKALERFRILDARKGKKTG